MAAARDAVPTGADVFRLDSGARRATKPGLVTVPRHVGLIIKPKTLAGVLDQAGRTADQLRDLL